MRGVDDALGMEGDSAAKTSEKHLAGLALETGSPACEVSAGKSVGCGVVAEPFLARIEARYPGVSTHPQLMRVVLEDAGHHVSAKAFTFVEVSKFPGCRIEP